MTTRRLQLFVLMGWTFRLAVALQLLAGSEMLLAQPRLKSPPLSVPFDAGQSGHRITQPFKITVLQTYSLQLFFHAKSANDLSRVYQVLRGAHKDPSGQWLDEGLPATFHIRVAREGEASAIVDTAIRAPKSAAIHNGRYVLLEREIRLPPGRYSFDLSVVETNPDLSREKCEAQLVRAYLGK